MHGYETFHVSDYPRRSCLHLSFWAWRTWVTCIYALHFLTIVRHSSFAVLVSGSEWNKKYPHFQSPHSSRQLIVMCTFSEHYPCACLVLISRLRYLPS
ncbi:hypothetical protein CC77DRAFT_272775 [Alternaria alternata]|uniref:Uncharacterized protein n=1 Tax=Alternaria alternata TaxID=5599 RepID=A0A177DCS2_ALTAL|nr:hypothetical protein CC77DRAFT_272775 [Alternaria alternata]OAG17091.1 hypothetical protein CC77DRAFT_272775 [Alternaria alternata]